MADPSSSEPNPKIFSVRIVSTDYYMAPPVPGLDISYSSFQGGKVNEVPVIRIFGSTPAGQKTCLHVHGALPYLYVPCSDLSLQPDQEGNAFTNAMSLAMEKALKLKGCAGSKRQHVHGCSLVRAKKFYGYHSSEELFLKTYLYHPQDVSRVSSLLLAGAVLDKILQPHESHIPYLLQFLVDYNLYGMGHLHVSKLKFRHPVPDVSHSRKAARASSQTDFLNSIDTSTPVAAGEDSCLASPIWTSSTIPDGWTWQSHCQPDSTVGHNLLLVNRQSTSELEGDAVVEDILNQQFISFSSLSQAHSEVKMVQSLIPIWEEFERSGMQSPVAPPDPGKPHAEDVLRTLSHGLEIEKLLAKLSDVEGNSSLSQQCIRSLADEGNSIGCDGSGDKAKEVSKSLEENDAAGSLSSGNLFISQNEYAERTSAEQNDHMKKSSIDQFQRSQCVEQANMKVPDQDALGLLKWLASSQAAEDINSDDELAHQTILSPLLPASTIDKVLEKANADIENQSQQECQDILDSVENFITSEESNGKANCENYNLTSHTLLDERNPQLDNSSDNFNAVPFGGKSSSEVKCESETSRLAALNHVGHKRKKPEWDCLPVSSNQRSNCIYVPNTYDEITAHNGGTKVGPLVREKNEVVEFPNVLNGDPVLVDTYKEEPSLLVGCSMRDLMRKKRCYRIELSESKVPQVREVLSKENQKEETFFCREQGYDKQSRSSLVSFLSQPSVIDKLESYCLCPVQQGSGEDFDKKSDTPYCSLHGKSPLSSGNANISLANVSKDGQLSSSKQLHPGTSLGGFEASHGSSGSSKLIGESRNDCVVIDAAGSSRHSSTHIGCKNFEKNVTVFNFGLKSGNSLEVTHMPSENLKETAVSAGGVFMKSDIQVVLHEEEIMRLPEIHSSTPSLRADHLELMELTFCQKPPVIEYMYERGENSAFLPCMALEPPEVNGKDEAISLNNVVLDGVLPFFVKDNQEEKELQNVTRVSECSSHQEAIIGVPIHYQNDGSYLYILTPVKSPPSKEHVERWLSLDGKNTLSDYTAQATALTTSLEQFPGDPMESKIPLCPVSDLHLLDSGSKPKSKPNSDRSNLNNQKNCDEEVGSPNYEFGRIHKDECETLASKPSTVLSQEISQLSGPDVESKLTPLSQMGFRDPASVAGRQQLTIVSVEIHAGCRGDLRPDPRFDAINIITVVIQEDDDAAVDAFMLLLSNTGENRQSLDGISDCKVLTFDREEQLFCHFTKIVSVVDPDILMGWDIQAGSIGFLAERAAYLGIGLLNNISRTPSHTSLASGGTNNTERAVLDDMFIKPNTSDSVNLQDAIIEDEWGRTHASGVHVGGRIVLNIWRLMRGELKLNIYTLEAAAEAVLRKKVPYIPHNVLAKWFSSGSGRARYRCMEYVLGKAKLNLHMMNQHDMINRTSELARVFGIDFFSVLSRGSQYRVESMFLRLAHTQNYVAISPGNLQVAYQPAMECLPLVMEPESGFYADPVVVLDFQSLYPSMIIAYNLCFCTCLGKIMPSMANILGVSSYSPDMNVLRRLTHELLLTPNGVMYVPSKVRKGVLPRLLEEILSTRILVKQAMKKLATSQLVLQRIFNARQLALKLISNVTYGYTAAGFSGRMPCAELADSIVQCGRRTLENAISFVNNHDKWKAKVIYGDTDSMFVLLKGRSRKEAFRIGDEIASAVSAMNPNPVVLKMEKVYHPCFLLTKKRYVGYSYEKPDQTKPKFDAKGIETVRRDSCGAVSKTMEQTLKIYFEHQDIDKVKTYLLRQWARIISGRVSLEDFVFAKEVRLGTYSARASSLPPAAIVATKAMRADPRAEPRYAERVPYVVVHGEPGARLVDMVVDPMELLAIDSPYRLNEVYYIKKQIIPALQRVFGLVGADLNQWFSDMPRPEREAVGKRQLFASCHNRTRIDSYYLSKHCVLCGALVQTKAYLCLECSRNEATVAIALTRRSAKLEKDIQHLVAICRHCGGGDWLIESGVKCTSLACSVFYERRKTQKELKSLSSVATEAGFYPKCVVEWF